MNEKTLFDALTAIYSMGLVIAGMLLLVGIGVCEKLDAIITLLGKK